MKDKNGNETLYKNTSWFNVAFFGDAAEKAKELKDRDKITILSGSVDKGFYEKDGEKFYPTNVVVYDFEWRETNGDNKGNGNSDPF